jgi:hypothetical protein
MAHAEGVEDLGGLDGALPEAAGAELVPPSDAGEGSSSTPAPTGAGEDSTPAPAPTCEDASMAVVETAAEDPATAVEPSQVAE